MSLIKLASIQEVPPGRSITVSIAGGEEIAIFNIAEKIYALNNSCPHMGGPLGEGDIEECVVTCPWHGWQFDIKTGACLNMPGEDALSLPIKIQDNEIFLDSQGDN